MFDRPRRKFSRGKSVAIVRKCSLISTGTFSALALAAFGILSLLATNLNALQTAGDAGTELKKEIEPLAPFLGEWECSGTFAKSGKPISSSIKISSDLDRAWVIVRHNDLPPNQFHALELWGFDKSSHQFENSVFDNFSGSRKFGSPGWNGTQFIWTRTEVAPDAVTERFLFDLLSFSKLQITWQVKKPKEDWIVGDTLVCQKQQPDDSHSQ
jgi:hypothetical protein